MITTWMPDAHESEMGDPARGYVSVIEPPTKPRKLDTRGGGKRDWHRKWADNEPNCAGNQWRQRDRFAVINIAEMDHEHLGHAIRFATTKSQHASRLAALVAERNRRTSR